MKKHQMLENYEVGWARIIAPPLYISMASLFFSGEGQKALECGISNSKTIKLVKIKSNRSRL